MRYRSVIYVDVWEADEAAAQTKVLELCRMIPNSYPGGTKRLPHGSKAFNISPDERTE